MARSISRLAKWLEWSSILAMALVCGLIGYLIWACVWLPGGAAKVFPGAPIAEDISQFSLILVALLAVIVPLVLIWTLNKMRRLFVLYRQGHVLTEQSADLIGRIGFGFLLVAFLPIVLFPIQSVLLSWEAPVGQRSFSVELDQQTLIFALAGGFVTLLGWAMKDATRIAEEHKSIV